jgi:hypothetical protein
VPDTMKFGATYLERARSYLTECRRTIDTFIIPELVDAKDRFRFPDSAAFAGLGSRYAGNRGRTVPWNQNTMLANGFLSIAMALDVLGEEPATVARYDAIVKAWVRALIDGGVVAGTAMGNRTYDWCYGSNDKPPACSEDVGHGGYDFWGVYRAYARPQLGLTMDEVVPFANTFRYKIMLGTGFAAKVDGSGTGGNVGSTWLYAAFFRHDIFPSVAGALVAAAKGGDPDTAGRILWSKYMNSRDWKPEDRYGDPPSGTDAGATPAPSPDAGVDEGSPGPDAARAPDSAPVTARADAAAGPAVQPPEEPTDPGPAPVTRRGGGCSLAADGPQSWCGLALVWLLLGLVLRPPKE